MSIVNIGLISDIQYCDCDIGWDYSGTQERFYRNSINHLNNAMKYFVQNKCKAVIQLGDVIDGKCKSLQQTNEALKKTESIFEYFKSDFEVFHVLGNHELYNLDREEFVKSYLASGLRNNGSESDLNYYKVDLASGVVLIVLDCYEISVLNRRKYNNDGYLLAKNLLTEKNTNASWNECLGIELRKYVAYNGGIGKDQVEWLNSQLEKCTENGDIVIIAGHIPLLTVDSNPMYQLWNSEDILSVIFKFTCVKAYLCGHTHEYDIIKRSYPPYHQITMPGVIEATLNTVPYSVLSVYSDKMILAPMKNVMRREMCFYF